MLVLVINMRLHLLLIRIFYQRFSGCLVPVFGKYIGPYCPRGKFAKLFLSLYNERSKDKLEIQEPC